MKSGLAGCALAHNRAAPLCAACKFAVRGRAGSLVTEAMFLRPPCRCRRRVIREMKGQKAARAERQELAGGVSSKLSKAHLALPG